KAAAPYRRTTGGYRGLLRLQEPCRHLRTFLEPKIGRHSASNKKCTEKSTETWRRRRQGQRSSAAAKSPCRLALPLPVADLRHVVAIRADVLVVVDQLVAELLFHVR